MSNRLPSWRHLAVIGMISILGACGQQPQPAVQVAVASNPPPVPPGPNAVWHHVGFDTGSMAINGSGQQVIADMKAYMQANPASVATIIGRTDTVGSNDYNMRLSHRRADAVRDALVYNNNISADRVETRWTGETRPSVATANDTASGSNRVVDIAIH